MPKPRLSYIFDLNAGFIHGDIRDFKAFVSDWVGYDGTSPREISRLLFNIALTTGLNGIRNPFDNGRTRDRARHFVYWHFPVFEQAIIRMQNEFRANDVADLFEAYNVLSITPEGEAADALYTRAYHLMGQFDARQLAKLLKNTANFARYPGDDWITKWWEFASEKLEVMGYRDIINSVYMLAIHDSLRNATTDEKHPLPISPCRDIAMTILEIHHTHFPNERPQQVHDAALYFSYDPDGMTREKTSPDTVATSRGERLYIEHFQRAGYHVESYTSPHLLHPHDMRVTLPDGKTFCGEIDGVVHHMYALSSRKIIYDGPTRFRTELMQRYLPEGEIVVRIPDYVLFHARNWKIPYAAAVVAEEVKPLTAGCYIIHDRGDVRSITTPDSWVFENCLPRP